MVTRLHHPTSAEVVNEWSYARKDNFKVSLFALTVSLRNVGDVHFEDSALHSVSRQHTRLSVLQL